MLRRKRFWFAIMAILPTFAIFGWVRLFPIIETLRLSMHEWNLLSKNKPFVGFQNFIELFGDNQFLDALANTAIIAFGAMAVTIPMSLVLGSGHLSQNAQSVCWVLRDCCLHTTRCFSCACSYGVEVDF